MSRRPASLQLRIASGDAELLERAAAEAYEAGASGALETPGALELFVPEVALAAVQAALAPFAREGLALAEPSQLRDTDWREEWKRGLGPVVISPRLLVRPPFAPAPPGFGGAQLVIEPGQAFGTGGHASTRLALEALDALPAAALRGARVLDVGCGSGVLALAALALGAAHALGCDVDPLATAAAREAAVANGCGERLALLTGSLDALGGAVFDLVVANLLRRELEPLLPAAARALAPGGRLVLSGLLASERAGVESALARLGLAPVSARTAPEPDGDAWLALVAERT